MEMQSHARLVKYLQIRRAYKTLITKEHPDKGGNPERFKLIKLSYDTLSNKSKVRNKASRLASATLIFELPLNLPTFAAGIL